jgi:hypothetical protein
MLVQLLSLPLLVQLSLLVQLAPTKSGCSQWLLLVQVARLLLVKLIIARLLLVKLILE